MKLLNFPFAKAAALATSLFAAGSALANEAPSHAESITGHVESIQQLSGEWGKAVMAQHAACGEIPAVDTPDRDQTVAQVLKCRLDSLSLGPGGTN